MISFCLVYQLNIMLRMSSCERARARNMSRFETCRFTRSMFKLTIFLAFYHDAFQTVVCYLRRSSARCESESKSCTINSKDGFLVRVRFHWSGLFFYIVPAPQNVAGFRCNLKMFPFLHSIPKGLHFQNFYNFSVFYPRVVSLSHR